VRWDETGYRLWRLVGGEPPQELEIPAEFQLAPRAGEPALIAPFGVLVDRLHRAISRAERMQPDFEDAVAVQAALDAARESSTTGARVRVERIAPVPSTSPTDIARGLDPRSAARYTPH